MSTLWTRMREIVTANSHAQLDALENPALIGCQLLREVDGDLQALRGQLVQALGRQRQLEASLARERAQQDEAQSRARRAVQTGDDDLARGQLQRAARAGQSVEAITALLQDQQQWVADLKRERDARLSEREELAGQARLLSLQPLAADRRDDYQRVLARRDRMRELRARAGGDREQLRAAQELRDEELGRRSDQDLDAGQIEETLKALKSTLETDQ